MGKKKLSKVLEIAASVRREGSTQTAEQREELEKDFLQRLREKQQLNGPK